MAKAAGSAKLSYKEIATSIRKGEFAPVYILSGEEEYFIDSLVGLLEERVVDPGDRDFNLFTYYGAETDVETVAATARQIPFMGERQLVLLKEAQAMNMARQRLEKLAPYMQKPAPHSVVVIAFKGEALSSTMAMMKAAAASGAVIFNSDRIRDYNLGPYIRDYCSSIGISIDDAASELLVNMQGNELKKLFSEIDKIISGNAGAWRITAEMVQSNTGFNRDFKEFDLTNALAAKDYKRAVFIIDYFSRSPRQHQPLKVLGFLFNFYSRLLVANSLSDRSDSSLMTALKARSAYSLKDIKTAMRMYSFRQTAGCIGAIREFDAHSKGIGSTADSFDLLRELAFKLVSL